MGSNVQGPEVINWSLEKMRKTDGTDTGNRREMNKRSMWGAGRQRPVHVGAFRSH